MTTTADDLRQATDAVARPGASCADYEALADVEMLAGQRQITAARRLLDTRSAWMAATIARRSRPELGHSGLAAQQGFLSPEALIQKSTGSTRNEAYKLVAVGTMMADAEAAEKLVEAALESPGFDAAEVAEFVAKVPWQAPIARAVTNGTLSVDAAESIRSGLGPIDAAVTAEKLGSALESLLAEASALNSDQVFKLARRLRDNLDAAGIAAREKQAHDDRFLKVYRLGNGKVRLNGLFAPEDGEFVLSVFDSVTSPRRGGVRFVDKAKAAWGKRVQDDPRSTDQIAADAFVQLLKIAGEADQGRVFGGRRPSVRVIVTEKAVKTGGPVPVEFAAHGQIEGSPVPVSRETIDRLLCDTGIRGIQFNHTGDIINVGRDERVFTEAQRAAMGVRDGGCRWVDCDRSPAWSEAHHINELTEGQRLHRPCRRGTALPSAPPVAAQPALEH